MATIGFIGLGKMGGPMAANLANAGHRVLGFDAVPGQAANVPGVEPTEAIAAAVKSADAVITMLPASPHVRAVYLGGARPEDGVFAHAEPGTLLIESSTIDVSVAREVTGEALRRGFEMVDAPVSGGVAGAEAGTLTFMVGGAQASFARAEPLLAAMGGTIVHTGAAGSGQAAKTCNNMMLGIQMISVVEAFVLAEKLGLAADKLFEVASTSSGQCWSLTKYCPVPGPVPNSPANRAYQAGFTADMMLKDLRLSQDAAAAEGATTALGAAATALYERFVESGNGGVDFSGIIKLVREGSQGQGRV